MIIGVVLLLFIIGVIWAIASRDGDAPEQTPEAEQTQLIDYADTSTTVQYEMRGRINAKEEHRVLRITVGRDSRTATIFEGYTGEVLKSARFTNNAEAYESFLGALENEGYTRARTAEEGVEPIGACSRGRRYDFIIQQGANTIQELWTTSCGNIEGTFAGRQNRVSTLFEAQIPNFDEFEKGVRF